MPGGDAIEARTLHRRVEELEPRLTRRLFQIAVRGKRHFMDDRRPAELVRLFAYELGVAARFLAAEAVVEMEHGESEVPLGRKLAQHVQEAQGIGAARYRYAHAGVAREHVVASDGR
jgi:hypothetical protein